jgi:hypothetical protein
VQAERDVVADGVAVESPAGWGLLVKAANCGDVLGVMGVHAKSPYRLLLSKKTSQQVHRQ